MTSLWLSSVYNNNMVVFSRWNFQVLKVNFRHWGKRMRPKTNGVKTQGLYKTDKLHALCCLQSFFEGAEFGCFGLHVNWITQISTDRDGETVTYNLGRGGGVHSANLKAGKTNTSQTSVSKVTELMRPLQTNTFCSPISQVKGCQSGELIDVECYQSVSSSSDQTNTNVILLSFCT